MDWTWDLREEKGNTRVLFGACDDDLVFHGDLALHCGADLPASVLGDLQFKALWSRYQRCHKEIPVGDVNLATCLHLGLTCLQLMTPQGWRIILCSTPTPGVNLVLFSRALDYQLTFNQQKHHKHCSFSKLWLARHLFFLIDLEIQECGEWIN